MKVDKNGPLLDYRIHEGEGAGHMSMMPIRLEIASRILTGHFDIQAKDIDYKFFAELALKQADALIEAHNKDQGE